jgi:hypothetical protein
MDRRLHLMHRATGFAHELHRRQGAGSGDYRRNRDDIKKTRELLENSAGLFNHY